MHSDASPGIIMVKNKVNILLCRYLFIWTYLYGNGERIIQIMESLRNDQYLSL